MTGVTRAAVIFLCLGFSVFINFAIGHGNPGGTIHTVDFAEIYYGDRCALQHKDLYDPAVVMAEFLAEGGKFPPDVPGKRLSDSRVAQIVLSNSVNLPTSFFVVLPLALLPWSETSFLWVWFSMLLLAVAAWLVWDLGAGATPAIWVCLAGFMFANCQQMLSTGNVAGAAVGLCVISAWCFLKQRYALLGVVLLAVSLILKPHDAGFIWLYFLLAGGTLRKRALQTLAVTAVIGLATLIWITRISPHWVSELHRNVSYEVVRGGIDDPGPTGAHQNTPAPVIDLQAAISVFKDDPGFYNLASYCVVGGLILVWIFAVLRKRGSPQNPLFALAPVAALTILPVYHRPYDAKLLLLMLPACAMLWAAKATTRWIAFALTTAAVFITSDIPMAIDVAIGQALTLSPATLSGKIATVLLLRPAPLILLATGCFYLWIYLRCELPPDGYPFQDASTAPAAAAAT
jgi:hypothetical protein